MPLNTDPLSDENQAHTAWWDTESFEALLESSSDLDTQTQAEEQVSEYRVYDSIKDLDSILKILSEKKYDTALIQPQEHFVWLTFRVDGREAEKLEISYPVYNKVLLEGKKNTSLIIEENSVEQEWKWKVIISNYEYFIALKTVPSKYWEKIWIKIKKNEWKQRVVKKVSPWAVLSFVGGIFFVWLVLWASFITFVILNAQTIEDVRFFATLWININEINAFISLIVTVVFSILLFLLSSVLSFFLFKFYFTKKIYRAKKISYALASVFFLILTSGTGVAWIYLDQQVKSLPNWQEQLHWDIKISLNDLRVSPDFTDDDALLEDLNNLVWPVTLHLDVSNYVNRKKRQNVDIERFVWTIGNQREETLSPELIVTLSQIQNYQISVEAIWRDIVTEEVRENIPGLPNISVSHLIQINENTVPTWWKQYSFDASSLSSLWNIAWYFKSPESNDDRRFPDWEKVSDQFEFYPGQIFYEPIYIAIWIQTWNDEEVFRKIFTLNTQSSSNIEAWITAEQSFENELNYRFQVTNAQTWFSDGFIEWYEWRIENRTYNVWPDINSPSASSVVNHIFTRYWEHTIRVTLRDTRWNERTLTKEIDIIRQMNLSESLEIIDSTTWRKVENLRYNPRTYEYFIDDLWVPTTLRFDARNLRPENILYRLIDVKWDIWDNGDIDEEWMQFEFELPTPWNHTLALHYSFQHRRNSEDIINIVEKVYIGAVRKEAIISLRVNTNTQYAPATVSFDASLSFIRDDDIVKFIYDYGNGVIEERNAINPWHRYTEPWEYTITLTAIGSRGGRYTTTEKLILLPTPQRLEVDASMIRAPVWQGIDFSSAGSQWQIVEYFWDFGDGGISTLPNPSHTYRRPGIYTVSLEVNFANFNTRSASMEIEIYE